MLSAVCSIGCINMSKSVTERKLDPLDVSPVRGSSSNHMTPIRPLRKLSRRDQGADVHTTCSTPNRFQFGTQCSSPSDSFPYSQEFRPDVIWDYTSPKLPGSKKTEIKITVDEFLKNLTQRSVPECKSQASNYVRLLEKWMTKQNTPVCVKAPTKNLKQNNRKRSRRVIEEIRQFMESIQKKNDKAEADEQKENLGEINEPKAESPNHFNISLNKKSFLDGDSNENDSTDDLWGEVDNSFIIKATQQLDVSSLTYNNVLDKNLEIVSTIPETVSSVPTESKYTFSEESQTTGKNILNKALIDPDHHAQILLTQIISNEWDSDSDNDDWENGFIEEDEALSLIPDEVLYGTDPKHDENVNMKQKVVQVPCQAPVLSEIENKLIKSSCENKLDTKDRSKEISFGCTESAQITCQTGDTSDVELFNNFEDESFGDESILCKPEVLSWIDEVESKLSQSQKCTPEEIEKKKDEAIQRRKRNLSRNFS